DRQPLHPRVRTRRDRHRGRGTERRHPHRRTLGRKLRPVRLHPDAVLPGRGRDRPARVRPAVLPRRAGTGTAGHRRRGAVRVPDQRHGRRRSLHLAVERLRPLGPPGAGGGRRAGRLVCARAAARRGALPIFLTSLSEDGRAPRLFARLSSRAVPVPALLATGAVRLFAFLTNVMGDGGAYTWLLNVSGLSGFMVWVGISWSHFRFR